MAFARAVTDMAEDIKRTCRGMPLATAANGLTPSALETLQLFWGSDASLWKAAELGQLYAYLRKNKALKIPDEWRLWVPKALD